ncbi:MAG: Formation of crista junctions protein 1 [Alyxoria varia]|nr:MAG: Formation of crista junctions protein 1 [Alyxoria varia]
MLRRAVSRRPPLFLPRQYLRKYATSNLPPTHSVSPNPATDTASKTAATIAKTPKKRRWLRRTFYFTTFGLVASYAGGIYYSLKNDNFNVMFTDSVPFAEAAVAYFEEREFKRRAGDRSTAKQTAGVTSRRSATGENKVTVGMNSGVSAKRTESGEAELGKRGKHNGATEDNLGKTDRAMTVSKSDKAKEEEKKKEGAKAPPKQAAEATKSSKTEKPTDSKKKQEQQQQQQQTTSTSSTAATPKTNPNPIPSIDPLTLPNASDPTLQLTTKTLNALITSYNADPTPPQNYASILKTAIDDLHNLASEITVRNSAAETATSEKIAESQREFDDGARKLIERFQREQQDVELQWREEYEAERERLARTYQSKLDAELEAEEKISEQKLKNSLKEQDMRLTQSFEGTVRDRVEEEREGRLARLNELSAQVADLRNLTEEAGNTLDSNLKTQHLLVAVEALRAALEPHSSEDRNTTLKPFTTELTTLKSVSLDNPLVNAAVASIDPVAYQRGIPTPGQLIDRFRRVASEVRKAALLPEGAGAASHAASRVMSGLLFRKEKGDASVRPEGAGGASGGSGGASSSNGNGRTLTAGVDVEATLTRAETLLEEGDLDSACREMNNLSGWARVLSQDWVTEVRRVLEVRQAVDVCAAEARLGSLMVR